MDYLTAKKIIMEGANNYNYINKKGYTGMVGFQKWIEDKLPYAEVDEKILLNHALFFISERNSRASTRVFSIDELIIDKILSGIKLN